MSVNKWIGIGNLTAAPELRFTQSGVSVCNFSIACNERYKDREGNQQEKVEFVNIVVWRGLADVCGKYLVKGQMVYIEGKIQTSSYDDRDGNKKYKTEIVANEMQMLSRGGEQRQEQTPVSEPVNDTVNQAVNTSDGEVVTDDEKIPF